MSPVQARGVGVDVCDSCRGIWCDPGELSRAAGCRVDEHMAGRDVARAARTQYRCPACAVPLYERQLGGSRVSVDQCVRCNGIYLDSGELTRLELHYQQADAEPLRPPPPRDHSDDKAIYVDPDDSLLAVLHYLCGLPVELDVPQTLFPPIVTALLAANTIVLIAAYGTGLQDWIDKWGLVPTQVLAGRRLETLLTAMFTHAGVLHLLGNAYFLYFAGDNIEERFGWWRFLPFYLTCGLAAGLADALARAGSSTPCVGASGAIAGIMGAYMVLFPHNRFLIRSYARLGFLIRPFECEIPAWAYLLFWIAVQLVFAVMDVPTVAWWAHIGGFACGALTAVAVRAAEAGRRDADAARAT